MTNESNSGLKIIHFSGITVPEAIELIPKDDNKYVSWGSDNLFPNTLIEAYQNSYTHSAIINNKTDYIIGNGLKLKNGAELRMKMNAADGIAEFTRKLVMDFLLFNSFAVEVVYNRLNQPIQYHHVPMQKLRANRSITKFWYAEDWKKGKSDYTYDRWTKDASDGSSKIFYFDGHFPTLNQVYPDQSYKSALKSMKIEALLQTYSLNLVDNHFAPSQIITFHQGNNIAEEQKIKIIKDLEKNFVGPNGKKFIVDFQSSEGKPASIQTIELPDADTFMNTKEEARNAILGAHEIVSPLLFGVKTEGQLGGATELETAYEIWKNKYVINKRNEIADALNMLFSNYDAIPGEVEFSDKPLFSTQARPETKEKIMTINEQRKEIGLPPLPNGDRLIDEASKEVQVQTPSTQFSSQLIELTEEDYEKIADMGTIRDDYEFHGDGEFVFSMQDMNAKQLAFETSQEIAEYIIGKKIKDITLPELKTLIRKDLGIDVTTDDLKEYISKINKSGIASIDTDEDGNVKVSPSEGDKPKRVEVMYAYELREGVSGAPIIETTRPFCRRLINNNRVYTRAEIHRMSQLFGYDVFNLGGGFYRSPSGEATPFCRHRFKSYTVTRRSRN